MRDSKLHFVIGSDYAQLRGVQEELLAAVQTHGFDDDAVHGIRLALEEGLINAIKHGNRLDPKKHVTIDARVTDKQAEFTIVDQGPGFDRNGVPDPTAEVNLEKTSGRGLLLIEAYMTEVKYADHGRKLWMIKRK